ncbi:MAG: hypothetical protein V4739_15960 [Pseudomonadota bacterium]
MAALLLSGCEAPTPLSLTNAAGPERVAAVTLPAPAPIRSSQALRLQAAQRIVQANPNGTYSTPTPDVLLAIPVLEVELNADGSVRRIMVLRRPKQAPETTQLAIDAVRRAAPFGDVSSLPRPRKFIETFLFDDTKRFKPRTLDR